jgi:hypothetical protein
MKTKLNPVILIDEKSIKLLNLEKEVRLCSMKMVAELAYERGFRDCERGLPFETGVRLVKDIFKRA